MSQYWEYIRQRVSRSQVARFGFSLLLATMLWGWVTQLQDPTETRSFIDVAIEEPDLPGTLDLVTTLPRVNVSVTDVDSRLRDLDRTDIVLALDIAGIDEPGRYQVPVIATSSRDLREVRISPEAVSIEIEEEVSRNVPLEIEQEEAGDDADRVVDVQPEISQVTVRGIDSAVDRVVSVVLPVSAEGRTNDFTVDIEPFAIDADGQRVQEVTIDPGRVRTFVEMETRGRTVSVVVQLSGAPAEGFIVQQQISFPTMVILDGPPEVLDSILFVNTEPVDISNADRSLSRAANLEPLPEGVTLVQPESSQVEVRVSIGTSSGTPNMIQGMDVMVNNLDDGLYATLEPETVDIAITAATDVLRELTQDDIEVTVDASGLGPGAYSLSPEVTLPENVALDTIDPQVVTLVITDEATPVAAAGESNAGAVRAANRTTGGRAFMVLP